MAHSNLVIRNKTSYLLSEKKVAKFLEIKVLYKDLEDDMSGFLVVNNGVASAVINENHPENRQRFTLAHEVGHFCLHVSNTHEEDIFVDKKFNRDGISSKGEVLIEIEANRFAANLLMPKEMLRDVISRKFEGLDLERNNTSQKVASVFGVSTLALGHRLRALNIISEY